jgi:pteridine reductase
MSNSNDSSKVVCVTGGSKRIGASIVKLFHQHGYRVIIHYNRSVDEATKLAASLNQKRAGSAGIIAADLCDAQQLEELASGIVEKFARLDVLVNNASSYYPTRFGNIGPQDWNQLVDSNLRGAFFLSQSLSQELSKAHGSIINIVDTQADQALRDHSVYCIAKSGLKSMTRSLALDLAPRIRVNGVSPGAILWPDRLENDDDPQVQEHRKRILSKIPTGRLGDVSEIAETVLFLANSASYITGLTIKVDGGCSLGF